MEESSGAEVRYKKISEHSLQYRDRELGARLSSDLVFGEETLRILQPQYRISPTYLQHVYGTSDIDEARKIAIRRSRAELAKKYKDPRLKSYVNSFYDGSRDLSLFLPFQKSDKGGTVEDLFDEEKTPDHVYVDLLSRHLEQFKGRKNKFENALPRLRKNFQSRLEAMMEEGRIPLSVSNVFNDRINYLSINLGDALSFAMEDRLGSFRVVAEEVVIAEQAYDADLASNLLNALFRSKQRTPGNVDEETPKAVEHAYVHEMLHFLSGRTLLTREYPEDPEYLGEVTHQRIGLQYNAPNPRFRWLNEAVTENLTMQFMNGKDNDVYKQERELMELLRTKGKTVLPEHLFIDAYFENYDPELPIKDRIPAWKKLQQVLNDAYEPGFLVHIDDVVRNEGTARAIEVVNQRSASN